MVVKFVIEMCPQIVCSMTKELSIVYSVIVVSRLQHSLEPFQIIKDRDSLSGADQG